MINRFILEGRLASDHAVALRAQLAAAPEDLSIDGTNVRGIGALCAQELCSAREQRAGLGGSWRLQASEEMQSDLQLLGLSHLSTPAGEEE